MSALPGAFPVTRNVVEIPIGGSVIDPGTEATAGFDDERVIVVLEAWGALILTVAGRFSPAGMVMDGHASETV